jgi:hypothetical protein
VKRDPRFVGGYAGKRYDRREVCKGSLWLIPVICRKKAEGGGKLVFLMREPSASTEEEHLLNLEQIVNGTRSLTVGP